MSISLIVTVTVVFLLSSVIIGYVFRMRNRIPCMTGMMIAMTLGMMVGLIIGVVLGVIYVENLFLSTILAMGIGMGAGFLTGIGVSLMAVLDGMLAGLMGGMMGAMTGNMISHEYQDTMIRIMFVLFIGIMLMVIYMIQQEVPRKKIKTGTILTHPFFMITVLGVFFFGYNQLGPTVLVREDGHHLHQDENMSIQKPDKIAKKTITVASAEFLFLPEHIHLKKGEKVTIVLKNEGNEEHDLEIVHLDAVVVEGDTHGSAHHRTGSSKVHIHTDPGNQKSITFIPLQSGSFEMVCTIQGHKERGMAGWITVM